MDCSHILCPWDSPGKNTGVGCHALLQGIFPSQGWNLHLLCLLAGRFFTTSATWEALHNVYIHQNNTLYTLKINKIKYSHFINHTSIRLGRKKSNVGWALSQPSRNTELRCVVNAALQWTESFSLTMEGGLTPERVHMEASQGRQDWWLS